MGEAPALEPELRRKLAQACAGIRVCRGDGLLLQDAACRMLNCDVVLASDIKGCRGGDHAAHGAGEAPASPAPACNCGTCDACTCVSTARFASGWAARRLAGLAVAAGASAGIQPWFAGSCFNCWQQSAECARCSEAALKPSSSAHSATTDARDTLSSSCRALNCVCSHASQHRQAGSGRGSMLA
jgi:hypothetical protein